MAHLRAYSSVSSRRATHSALRAPPLRRPRDPHRIAVSIPHHGSRGAAATVQRSNDLRVISWLLFHCRAHADGAGVECAAVRPPLHPLFSALHFDSPCRRLLSPIAVERCGAR